MMPEICHLENREIAISQQNNHQFQWHLVHNSRLGIGDNHVTKYDKKLSCHRETARCFMSLNISLSLHVTQDYLK